MNLLTVPGLNETQCAVAARAGNYGYYVQLVDGFFTGACAFCGELDPAINKVVIENDHWRVWQNIMSPEKGTRVHVLIVPRRHVRDVRELDADERRLFWEIQDAALEMYDIASCGFLARNGNATLSAGTIEHLHFHIMVPNGTERVESPFYKGAASEAVGHARAILFERLRNGTITPDKFTEDEMGLMTDKRPGDRLKGYVVPTA